MMVLFLTRLFYPHIGGVETHVRELSKGLQKQGHDVFVLTERFSPDLKEKEIVEGAKVYRFNPPRGIAIKVKTWIAMIQYIPLIIQSDIIHCHDVFFWYLPFRFLFPFKKVFTTFHGYESYPVSKKAIAIRKMSEILSWGNICIGDYIKKWYGTKPDFISYGGVNIVKSEKLKIKNEKSAVFIGRLDEQTGILTYVEAVKILRKKIPNFDFSVIGDGKLREKIDNKTKILKPLDNAAEYFQKYNFAFVSRYLSILEAMAAKRLVFAVYDNPLKEDYLRMAPFSRYILISNSASDLVSKISFHLNNLKERERLVENAYKWAEKYTWEEMANIYMKLWKINF